MSNDASQTSDQQTESLVSSFHRVKSLIPNDQELITIPPEMRVSEALKLMKKYHFSQLPVVAGDAVLGVFSFRSFSDKALAKQKSARQPLGELPVEDFLEQFEYTHADDDWNRVLRYLNQEDAFLVGHSNHLEGMVTTMDMLAYFQEIANPFIMIAEIELSLRQIIQTCIESNALLEAIEKSLKTAYSESAIPTDLNQMTFDNYVQIVSNGENWPHFKQMFGDQERTRKQTNQKLKQLGEWRNIIFHFRRRLEQWELDTLAEHREWLHRRVRAFEGRRRKAEAQQKPGPTSRSTKRKWDEPSFFADLESKRGVDDVSVARHILDWAQSKMTRIWWGEGKRHGSFVPVLNHNNMDYQLFAVWTSGGVEIYFYWLQRKPPFDSKTKRLELLSRLNDLPGVSLPDTVITKRPSISLSLLYGEMARQQFLEIFDWVVHEIQADRDVARRHVLRLEFWEQLLNRSQEKTNLYARVSPNKDNWLSTSAGKSGIIYEYIVRMRDTQVQLVIARSKAADNKQLFDKLLVHKKQIESTFGNSLDWERSDDLRNSYIRYRLTEGGLKDRDQWPEIQEKMIDAMMRLEKAFRDHIQQL